MTYKVGALFWLNSQWKTRMVFRAGSQLSDGPGLLTRGPRRKSSTPVIVLMLIAPGICPPLYS